MSVTFGSVENICLNKSHQRILVNTRNDGAIYQTTYWKISVHGSLLASSPDSLALVLSGARCTQVQLVRVCIPFPCLVATRNVTLKIETLNALLVPPQICRVGID